MRAADGTTGTLNLLLALIIIVFSETTTWYRK